MTPPLTAERLAELIALDKANDEATGANWLDEQTALEQFLYSERKPIIAALRALASTREELERVTKERDEARGIATDLHDEDGAQMIHPIIEGWPSRPDTET